MELFLYSCNEEAPFPERYKYLDSDNKKLLISNHKQHIDKFATNKERILDEAIGETITDKKILVPRAVKPIFLGWIKEKYGDDAKFEESTFNTDDFCSLGADELNSFIREINVKKGWKNVTKSKEPNGGKSDIDKSFRTQMIVIISLIIIAIPAMYHSFYLSPRNLLINAEEALIKGELEEVKKLAEDLNAEKATQFFIAAGEIEQAKIQESFLQEDYKQSEKLAKKMLVTNEKSIFAKQILEGIKQVKDAKRQYLLDKAVQALKSNKLTEPPENNVQLFAEQMLTENSNDTKAKELLSSAIKRYISLIKGAKKRENKNRLLKAVKRLKQHYSPEQAKEINLSSAIGSG